MQSLKEFSIYTKRVFDAKDAFALRENAIALGIDEKVMEENAGYAIANQLRHKYKDEDMLFVCGTGGKGAIGLSAARHMLNYANVRAAFLGDPSRIHNESTAFNYRMLSDIMDISTVGPDNVGGLEGMAKSANIVIDAIVGVGMKGRLSGFIAAAVRAINSSRRKVIALDIPTGMNPDTGVRNMACIRADELLALHKLKRGAASVNGIESTSVLDVGVPLSAELFTGPGDIGIATEPRLLSSNKYTHGNVLIIGGSEEYKGAPILAAFAADNAMAALRVGSGYVTIAAPKKVVEITSKMSPLIVTREISGGEAMQKDMPLIKTIKHDVAVVGPGLNRSESVMKAVGSLLGMEKAWGNIVVVDATALHALRKYLHAINDRMILTPHEGEFEALTGVELKGLTLERKIKKAIEFARNYPCTLVLKGNRTIITDGNVLKINRAKTPVLATMGTGDVLSGMIASYAASHKNPFESAVAAVYAHSTIADMLYAEKGIHVTAQDVVERIPQALKPFDAIA